MEINKAEIKEMLPLINQMIPTEMLKKILEKLDYKSLCFASQCCRRWRDIIKVFELKKMAASKSFEI